MVDFEDEEVMDVYRRSLKSRNGSVMVIPHTLTNGKDLVVLTRDEYETLHVIAEGERAYRVRKTVKASSLEDALKLHARRAH